MSSNATDTRRHVTTGERPVALLAAGASCRYRRRSSRSPCAVQPADTATGEPAEPPGCLRRVSNREKQSLRAPLVQCEVDVRITALAKPLRSVLGGLSRSVLAGNLRRVFPFAARRRLMGDLGRRGQYLRLPEACERRSDAMRNRSAPARDVSTACGPSSGRRLHRRDRRAPLRSPSRLQVG